MRIQRLNTMVARVVAAGIVATAVIAAGIVAMPRTLGAQDVRIKLGAWPESVVLDTLRQNHDLMADPRKVYDAVLKAFGEFGIPVGRTDGKAGIIGSERFERIRTLADAPMAKWLDCGGVGPSGPHANEYRVEIGIVAWVEPGPQGSRLGVAMAASARDVSGVFRNPMGCQSTGALEQKIVERVAKLSSASE
jgi:hypothetical protein